MSLLDGSAKLAQEPVAGLEVLAVLWKDRVQALDHAVDLVGTLLRLRLVVGIVVEVVLENAADRSRTVEYRIDCWQTCFQKGANFIHVGYPAPILDVVRFV